MAAGSSSVRADILWLCRAREPRRAGEAPAAARGGGRGRSSREAPAPLYAWGVDGSAEGGGRAGGRRGAPGCGRPEWAALGAGWGRVGRPARPGPDGGADMGASSRRGWSLVAAGRVVEEEEKVVAGRAHVGARCKAESKVVSGATRNSPGCGDGSTQELRCPVPARRPLEQKPKGARRRAGASRSPPPCLSLP